MKLSSPSSSAAPLALLLATSLGGIAASTEYRCPSGSSCTLASNGGDCSPKLQGLPAGVTCDISMTGQSVLPVTIPYECIGISDTDLESGGGSCIVTCPDSCTIKSGVENPCGSSPAPAPPGPPSDIFDLTPPSPGPWSPDIFDSTPTPPPPGPTPILPPLPHGDGGSSGYTQYDCPSGSSCTLSTEGGLCQFIADYIPEPFIANLGSLHVVVNVPGIGDLDLGDGGKPLATDVPRACIGIQNNHLESGGGNCIMTCPDTCTITYNKFLPCSGSSPAIRAFSSLIVAFAGIGAAFQYILV